jgi:hypothetical protein
MLGYLTDQAGLGLFRDVTNTVFGGEPATSQSSVYLYTGDIPTDGTGAPTGTLLGSAGCIQSTAAAATVSTYKNTPVYRYLAHISASGTVGYVAVSRSGYAPGSGSSALFLTAGGPASGAECIIDTTDVNSGDTVSITINANIF